MPDFNPANLRGHDAVEKALKSGGGGGFTPFVPQLTWKDGEEKFVLFISPADRFYTVDLHEWIETGTAKKRNGDEYTKFEQFISRKSLGEKFDKIQDELDRDPRRRTLAVAVELEPTYENVRGRQRFAGATVKTETYTRKTDDGDEEVETPVIGMVVQAQKNFFGYLISFDRSQAPVHETPFGVTRRGSDSETAYDFVPFMDAAVDLSGLVDNLDGINYLNDEVDGLEKEIQGAESDFDAAAIIGTKMLDKRFDELADADRYEDLVGDIDELPASRFAKPKKESSGSSRKARPTRTSPRSSNGSEKAPKSERFAELRNQIEGAEVEA